MRTEMIIRMRGKAEKGQTKAMKVAAAVSGVESVTLAGSDKSLLLVIGDGVDSNKLTKKLKEKVGAADIVELRTLDSFEAAAVFLPSPLAAGARGTTKAEMAMAAARSSPYHQHQVHHHQVHHNNNHQMGGYGYSYTPTHSPYAYHYYPSSPMGGYGYGSGLSSYSLAVARNHPANYSPLVERHDYQPMDKTFNSTKTKSKSKSQTTMAVPRRESGGSCCVIM